MRCLEAMHVCLVLIFQKKSQKIQWIGENLQRACLGVYGPMSQSLPTKLPQRYHQPMSKTQCILVQIRNRAVQKSESPITSLPTPQKKFKLKLEQQKCRGRGGNPGIIGSATGMLTERSQLRFPSLELPLPSRSELVNLSYNLLHYLPLE